MALLALEGLLGCELPHNCLLISSIDLATLCGIWNTMDHCWGHLRVLDM